MESTDSLPISPAYPQLPPGFRFQPTDEELIIYYLSRKASSAPLPVSIIAEIDLYKFDPWELPSKAVFGEQEWYFFSPRDRKYPNGARPNRAATSGYWKATGTDKPILASTSSTSGVGDGGCGGGRAHKVGVKKALVFYGGKPPRGVKTDWIMHEYRLVDSTASNVVSKAAPRPDFGSKKTASSLRLDDWVLCRIYKKNYNGQRPFEHEGDVGSHHHHHSPFHGRSVLPPPAATAPAMPFFGGASTIFGAQNTCNDVNPADHQFGILSSQAITTGTATNKRRPPTLMAAATHNYWDVEEMGAAGKRFHHQSDQLDDNQTAVGPSAATGRSMETDTSTGGGGDGSTFVSLLNQLPTNQSAPSYAAASALLGSLGGPFQLSNATWN